MNAYRHTPDGSLDRKFLRSSAVYRCVRRFGMDRDEAMRRLCERYSKKDAAAMISVWVQAHPIRIANPEFCRA